MNKPPRILVATALDDSSTGAHRAAARLAASHGAATTLLHVVEEDLLASLVRLLGGAHAEDARRLHAEQEAELSRALADMARVARVPPVGALEVGEPHAVLAAAAHRVGADLVITGKRSTPSVRGLLLGTTVERVLDRAAWPVLAVRGTAEAPWKRVAVAVDFSACSRDAVRAALAWAPGARLLLLNAYQVPFEMKLRHAGLEDRDILQLRANARAEALALLDGLVAANVPADARDRVEVRAVHGDAGPTVLAEVVAWGAELLVTGRRGHDALAEQVLGSVARHLLSEAPCDVLVASATPGA